MKNAEYYIEEIMGGDHTEKEWKTILNEIRALKKTNYEEWKKITPYMECLLMTIHRMEYERKHPYILKRLITKV